MSALSTRVPAPAPSRRSGRYSTLVVWASWPVGFLLIAAHSLAGLFGSGVFVVLAILYAGTLAAALRSYHSRGPATLLVLAGPTVFVLAGLIGPPTARQPGAMLLNAAVLAAASVLLLVGRGARVDGHLLPRGARRNA